MAKRIGVVDLGFGDSGKGITTAFLAQQYKFDLNIRSNGGHQAGHTVVKGEHRHVFSQFGAATFEGVRTYLPETFTLDPRAMLNEYTALIELGYLPKVIVHPLAMIVTPWDIEVNQIRAENGHGTVGVGFGTTIERNENHCTLHAQDLLCWPIFANKLDKIREYYAGVHISATRFIEDCMLLAKMEFITIHNLENEGVVENLKMNLLFESAQGVLLDQRHGVFPNVTRSNTTSKNMKNVFGLHLTDVYYVTRTYQTRHGNGFMTNLHNIPELINTENETNVSHEFQGKFRITALDTELLKHSLRSDAIYHSSSIRKHLVITCCDQFVGNIDRHLERIVEDLETVTKFDTIFTSWGPDPDKMIQNR